MARQIDKILTKVLTPRLLGEIDYLFKPKLKNKFGGPFNGQEYRVLLYNEIMRVTAPQAIIETGTFRGTTTALFSDCGPPVYTCELNKRYFFYSRRRFKSKNHVHVFCQDSRDFLRDLSKQGLYNEAPVFFYLDAHWGDDLPLLQEVEIIFSNWHKAIVMIDDFNVPGTDYTYDSYGPHKTLQLKYLERLENLNLAIYYPSTDPAMETGKKRGCVVLCVDRGVADKLDTIDLLYRYSP